MPSTRIVLEDAIQFVKRRIEKLTNYLEAEAERNREWIIINTNNFAAERIVVTPEEKTLIITDDPTRALKVDEQHALKLCETIRREFKREFEPARLFDFVFGMIEDYISRLAGFECELRALD